MKRLTWLLVVALVVGGTLRADDANRGKRGVEKKEPAKALKPVNLAVNTKADEDEPYSAGNQLYFATNASGKFSIRMASRPNAFSRWSKSQPAEGVDTEGNDQGAFFVSERTGFQYL